MLENEWLSFEQMIAPDGVVNKVGPVKTSNFLVDAYPGMMKDIPSLNQPDIASVVQSSKSSDSKTDPNNVDDDRGGVEDAELEKNTEDDDIAFLRLRKQVKARVRSSSSESSSSSSSTSSSRLGFPDKGTPSPPHLSPINSVRSHASEPPDLMEPEMIKGKQTPQKLTEAIPKLEVTRKPKPRSKSKSRIPSKDKKHSHKEKSKHHDQHSSRRHRSHSHSKDGKHRHSSRERHRHRAKKSRDRKPSRDSKERSKSIERKVKKNDDVKRNNKGESSQTRESKSENTDKKEIARKDNLKKDVKNEISHKNNKSRSRSRERKDRKERKRSISRNRHRGHSRDRSRSKERKHSRSKDRKRSTSNERKQRRSRSKDRRSRGRHRSKERRSRSHSHERLSSPVPGRKLTFKEQMRKEFINASKGMCSNEVEMLQKLPIKRPGEPLRPSDLLKGVKLLVGDSVTPQMALMHTMAAMHKKAQELTGVEVPKYYNLVAVNPLKYAEQVQKRKLLWSKKSEEKDKNEQIETQWKSAFMTSEDRETASKFRKLMGIRNEEERAESVPEEMQKLSEEQQRKTHELFERLDQEYQFARMTTHTQRGVGLGFATAVIDPNLPSNKTNQPT